MARRVRLAIASVRARLNAHCAKWRSGLAAKDTKARGWLWLAPLTPPPSSSPLRYAYSTLTSSWSEGRRNGLMPRAFAMLVVLTLLCKFLAREAP